MYVDTCLWIRVSFIFPKFVLQLKKLSKSAPFAFQVMAKISVHTDKVVVLIAVDKNGNNYPEIGDGNFKGALWTFIQWLALKMRERYGISIVLLLTSSYTLRTTMTRTLSSSSLYLNTQTCKRVWTRCQSKMRETMSLIWKGFERIVSNFPEVKCSYLVPRPCIRRLSTQPQSPILVSLHP